LLGRHRLFPDDHSVIAGKTRHEMLGALEHEVPSQMGKAEQRSAPVGLMEREGMG
jgi:hypothetical protein